MNSWKRQLGFTMLELLAVLAIILILSAILFPAIESAREKSLTTACSQNLKNLALAVTQYEQDKGQFPAGRLFTDARGSAAANDFSDISNWYHLIGPYMNASPLTISSMSGNPLGVLVALQGSVVGAGPGDEPRNAPQSLYPDSYRCPKTDWDKASTNMSYGYNYHYLGNADPIGIISGVVPAPGIPGFVNYPVTRGSIQAPDRTICVADSNGVGFNGDGSYISAGINANAQPATAPQGAYGYLLDPPFLPVRDLNRNGAITVAAPVPGIDIPVPAAGFVLTGPGAGGGNSTITLRGGNAAAAIQQQYRSAAAGRHKGNCNVAYLDAHVATRPVGELTFAVNVARNGLFVSNAEWNGLGYDNDLNGDRIFGGVNSPGEVVVDSNEAFPGGWVAAAAGSPIGAAPSVCLYNLAGAGNYAAYTGLMGAYTGYGPGFNVTGAFLTGAFGPTLPREPELMQEMLNQVTSIQ